MFGPAVCRYEHFTTGWYAQWAGLLGLPTEVSSDNPRSYRKDWEFVAMLETLEANGMLGNGKSAIGFAVGQEPLPSVFASRGVTVLATDLMSDQSDERWTATGQHAANCEALFHSDLVGRDQFNERVSFKPADMTDLTGLDGQFDFLWSSCAFEHLGTLEAGLDFVVNAMRLLKPGGLAVHTTEYNVSSNDDTLSEGPDCVYRRRDFETLDYRLRRIGCGLDPIDFFAGTHSNDLCYDRAPFFHPGSFHIKLEIGGFICTSVLLVARKG